MRPRDGSDEQSREPNEPPEADHARVILVDAAISAIIVTAIAVIVWRVI